MGGRTGMRDNVQFGSGTEEIEIVDISKTGAEWKFTGELPVFLNFPYESTFSYDKGTGAYVKDKAIFCASEWCQAIYRNGVNF